MSDPVTNVEDVEDVLSSIRRLVSETSSDKRAAQAEGSAGQETAPSAEAKPQEALVLTSALRIKGGTADLAPDDAPETEGAKPSDLESLRKAVSGEFDDEVAGVEDQAAAEEEMTVTWAHTAPEDYYEDEPDQADDVSLDAEADTAWVEDETDDQPDDVAEIVEMTDEAEVEIELDSAENDQPDDVAQDAEEDGVSETAEIHHLDAGQHEDEAGASDEGQATGETDEAEYEISEDGEDDSAEESSELYAADDAEVSDADDGDRAEDDEQVGDDQEDDGAQAIIEDGHDTVETVGIASFLRSSGVSRTVEEDREDATVFAASDEDEDDAPVDLGDLDEAVIDEDMLRDLVSEIVRQELTGAMGERITRNVRKLVRREIHRALVAREFE